MLPQNIKKAVVDNPKKVAGLVNLVELPSALKEFVGQSQISRLGCFMRVWSYIKANNLQDPNNKNVINCDSKLKKILLGQPRVELAELPELIKLHFSKHKSVGCNFILGGISSYNNVFFGLHNQVSGCFAL